MKIFVLIKRVCKHSDIKFECKNQFCKYVKYCTEAGKLPDFHTIFNIFAKLIFALKLNI